MKKRIDPITINYIYDANRNNAHYSFDGEKFMNGGEFAECVDKFVRGYAPVKDGNTPYDVDSDIPELGISVKSQRCGLTDKRLADNFEDFKKVFFKNVHSWLFDWAVILDDDIIIYTMNKKEFREFVDTFSHWDEHDRKVRFYKTTIKMLKWLDARVE